MNDINCPRPKKTQTGTGCAPPQGIIVILHEVTQRPRKPQSRISSNIALRLNVGKYPRVHLPEPSAPSSVNWVSNGSVNGLSPVRCYAGLLSIWHLTPRNKFQWNSNRNSIIFNQDNVSEIVVCRNGDHFVQGKMSWWPQKLNTTVSANNSHPGTLLLSEWFIPVKIVRSREVSKPRE